MAIHRPSKSPIPGEIHIPSPLGIVFGAMRRTRYEVLSLLSWLGVQTLAWITEVTPGRDDIMDQSIDQSSSEAASWLQDVAVIKVGGSSITNKAVQETLNSEALDWFAQSLATQLHESFLDHSPTTSAAPSCPSTNKTSAFVVIHGAGSFGHHTAKQYGLKGQVGPPPSLLDDSAMEAHQRKHQMQGLAHTRLSVRTLNQHVVSVFLQHGIHAVGISPCFGIAGMQAHGGGDDANTIQQFHELIYSTLQAGLIPVLHGDACLYGKHGAGILSGDTLMELLAKDVPWVSRAIFLTDVDGVFTKDPRTHPGAELLRSIQVDRLDPSLVSVELIDASGSSHEHDVTGGLKTKLASAASIAASGTNVTIARCGSVSAERVIQGQANVDRVTVVYGKAMKTPR